MPHLQSFVQALEITHRNRGYRNLFVNEFTRLFHHFDIVSLYDRTSLVLQATRILTSGLWSPIQASGQDLILQTLFADLSESTRRAVFPFPDMFVEFDTRRLKLTSSKPGHLGAEKASENVRFAGEEFVNTIMSHKHLKA